MIHRPDALDLTTTFTPELGAAVVKGAGGEGMASPQRAMRFLLLLKGRGGVQVAELGPGNARVVGRSVPADLIVDDPSLSRQHARLCWQAQGVLVEDLGSKNGTACAGTLVESVLAQPGMDITLGNVELVVRHALDVERRGFDDFERFLSRIDDELIRARTLARPMSLLMLRALPGACESAESCWLRVRAELRPIDTIAMYAPGALAILLPELSPAETRFAAQALVAQRVGEPALVCGIATLQVARTTYQLIDAASSACRSASHESPVVQVDGRGPDPANLEPLVMNPSMQEIYRVARRVASHAAPLLILGETGTGKELVARHTHNAGARRDRPFRAINCGAIPSSLLESALFGHERGAFTGASDTRKGVFEEAHGGTLFLDEVGELPLAAQAALLRVIETKQLTRIGGTRQIDVDVRIVSATHCDIEAMVETKRFRADLYHRLNLLTVRVPPLRERADEIEAFALRFLSSSEIGAYTNAQTISSDALALLRAYAWPGNVRELRNVIERAALLSDATTLRVEDLPERVRSSWPAQTAGAPPRDPEGAATGRFADLVRNYEIQLIREALVATGGNQRKAAEQLDMPLRTLVYKIRSYGLRGNPVQTSGD